MFVCVCLDFSLSLSRLEYHSPVILDSPAIARQHAHDCAPPEVTAHLHKFTSSYIDQHVLQLSSFPNIQIYR